MSGTITGIYSDVREKYKIDPKELGHGHYGVVRRYVLCLFELLYGPSGWGGRCQDRLTGEWFACKTIKKAKVTRIER